MRERLILAVRRQGVEKLVREAGFRDLPELTFLSELRNAGLWLGPRADLETDETYLQLIPYIVLATNKAVVTYRRTPSGSEKRLHGLRSIGVGGHVDLADVVEGDAGVDVAATLSRAAQRELGEEIAGAKVISRRWVGTMFDAASAVSRVHLGIVGVWQIYDGVTEAAEEAIGDARLQSLDSLEVQDPAWEAWSASLLPHLRRLIGRRDAPVSVNL